MGFLTRMGLPILLNRVIQLAPVFPMVHSEILLGLLLAACVSPEIASAVGRVHAACAAICSGRVYETIAIARCFLASRHASPSLFPLLTALSPRASPVF